MKHTLCLAALLLGQAAGAQTVDGLYNVREVWVSPTTGEIHVSTTQDNERVYAGGSEDKWFEVNTYPYYKVKDMMGSLIAEQPGLTLLAQALSATGLTDMLNSTYADADWNQAPYEPLIINTGTENNYTRVPNYKYQNFTLFACPDKVLAERYGITSLQTFYDYARTVYGGEAINVQTEASRLREEGNPLRRLVAYHILRCKCEYDALVSICTIDTRVVNPVDWYPTCDPLTTIKIDKVTVTDSIEAQEIINDGIYLNRGDRLRNCRVPGIYVRKNGGFEAANGQCYLIDGLADYGAETQATVFNTRIRIDLTTIFPEIRANNLLNPTPWDRTSTTSPKAPAANYWFPNGYLEGAQTNEDGYFFYQGRRNWYWCYQGDEFQFIPEESDPDLTFTLPSVPTGTYQIRLGICGWNCRGIYQFYLDGQLMGIPLDMGDINLPVEQGWVSLSKMQAWEDEERMQAAKKTFHANGWYHGPASVFAVTVVQRDIVAPYLADNYKTYFCDIARLSRRVLCTVELDGSKPHTLRCKRVGDGNFQLDYIEFVPKSVYDGDVPEDDY